MGSDTLVVVFIPGFNLTASIRGHTDPDFYRSATYLTVLDVLLLLHRPVHQYRDHLSAVGTANGIFLKQVH